MTTVLMGLLKKSFSTADEVLSYPKTRIEIVRLGDYTLMRATFQPGWRWSECMKPSVGTDLCEGHHLDYIVSGCLGVVTGDGLKETLGPGDVVEILPGHDAWVIGNEPCVAIDFLAGPYFGK